MPEWRKIFEAEDSDFWRRGLGAMEVCSSDGMVGTGDHGPKTDRSRPIAPDKRESIQDFVSSLADLPGLYPETHNFGRSMPP